MNAYFRCIVGSVSSSDGVALIVECDSNFAGTTITATNGTDTFTEQCPSATPYTVTFPGIPTGTYTISGIAQGQTFSTTFTVLDYTVGLYSTPDGSTVTPINDIQIWLHCANIWNKNYTTLDEVLADNTTLLALISDNNAVDYMVRSTEWSGNGQALVPNMTSATTPSGQVLSTNSDTGTTYAAYYAFDGNSSTRWNAGTSLPQRIAYKFLQKTLVSKITIQESSDAAGRLQTFDIVGSNDGTNWDVLYSGTKNSTDIKTVELSTIANYQYYGLVVKTANSATFICALQFYAPEGICFNQTAMGYIGNNDYAADTLLADATWLEAICNSEYFESVLNVKVPTMTSNTTPSGEVIGSTEANTGWQKWQAFDGTASGWCTNTTGSDAYIGYMFSTPTKVRLVKVIQWGLANSSQSSQRTMTIQGSNDNSNWVDIGTIALIRNIYTDVIKAFVNSTSYQYYRMKGTFNDGGQLYVYINELQFYGRA